jgi:hypothetical protein
MALTITGTLQRSGRQRRRQQRRLRASGLTVTASVLVDRAAVGGDRRARGSKHASAAD